MRTSGSSIETTLVDLPVFSSMLIRLPVSAGLAIDMSAALPFCVVYPGSMRGKLLVVDVGEPG
jgi:hypothetical protein